MVNITQYGKGVEVEFVPLLVVSAILCPIVLSTTVNRGKCRAYSTTVSFVVLKFAWKTIKKLWGVAKKILKWFFGQIKMLDTTNMFLEFKNHVENINSIRGEMQEALKNEMKSEHLKTELITNVSHDIKTPPHQLLTMWI